MIIGKRNLKILKLFIVSPKLEKLAFLCYLIFIPFLSFYEQIQLSGKTLNSEVLERYFRMDVFRNAQSPKETFSYFLNEFASVYFEAHSVFLPVQPMVILQQRCEECAFSAECVSTLGCEGFSKRQLNYTVPGRYGVYSELNYKIALNFSMRELQGFDPDAWIDNSTQALVVLASVYDLKASAQIQMIFLSEMPYDIQKQTVQLYQVASTNIDDDLHDFLFFSFVIATMLLTFRTLLELAYIFSKFQLVTQILHFTALYFYIFLHLYRLIELQSVDSGENLLFKQSAIQQALGIAILAPEQVLKLQDVKSAEEFVLLLLWLVYPFRLMYLGFQAVTNTWLKHFLNAIYRTQPTVLPLVTMLLVLYLNLFLPHLFLSYQYSIEHQNMLIQLVSKPFRQARLTSYFDYAFEWLQMMVYYLVLLYAAGVVTAAYRKAATKEMELHSKYELRVSESIETLSAKMNKFIKEIIKTFVKEKKKSEKKNEEIIESELLDDFSVMETEKRGEKILIVYEIHNTYLEEINRYKQKKENNHYASSSGGGSSKMKHSQQKGGSNNFGSIISQLLQKSTQRTNQRLKNMLSKYQSSDGYVPISEEGEEKDFFQEFGDEIQEQDVTIRSFCILDQVIKFLLMLLKLRPEFLSLNAEQRIRVFFFINSDKVSEDEVYKMLSFLIVNFQKNHLQFPVLIFSHHRDWYIEKDKYLTLKKFYKNIFSTLDKECALQFCVMQSSFLELQLKYAQKQEFLQPSISNQDEQQIDIQNSVDELEKSDLN